HSVSPLPVVQPPLAHHRPQLTLQQSLHEATQDGPAGRALPFPRDDMDHGTGLPTPPALEERAHGGPRFRRAEPVQVQLGIRPRVEQRVARVERRVATSAPLAHAPFSTPPCPRSPRAAPLAPPARPGTDRRAPGGASAPPTRSPDRRASARRGSRARGRRPTPRCPSAPPGVVRSAAPVRRPEPDVPGTDRATAPRACRRRKPGSAPPG